MSEKHQPVPKLRASTNHFHLILDSAGVTEDVFNQPYAGQGTAEDPYQVDFLPNDPHNAMNFPQARKWSIMAIEAIACLAIAFVSTAYTGGVGEIIVGFGVSTTVSILGISLFVVGFAVGPLFWAPLSELFGRQNLFIITYFFLTLFTGVTIASKNIETLIVLRFLAGAFGSSPLTNAGGVIADMFPANERGAATAIFALAPFLGPAIGPIAGGFLGESKGWKWVFALMTFFTGAIWIAGTVCVPETFAIVLLRRRAAKLSKLTGHVYKSRFDVERPPKPIAEEFRASMSRPWILLFREPIVTLSSLYVAILYGTLYLCFAAFPVVYQQERGWSPGIGGLAFIGVAVGMVLGTGFYMYLNRQYARIPQTKGRLATPEDRLPPSLYGSVLIPLGLFWFAWTNAPSVHWVVSIIGTGVFSFGFVLVLLSLMNYLIDSYVVFAASALAANAVLRSLFGAAFPLFTTYMYKDLGIHWASSIPAFLALACVPFPFLFSVYGGRIRQKCPFSSEAAMILEQMRSKLAPAPVTEDEAMERAEEHDLERRLSRIQSRKSNRSSVRRASMTRE